MDSLLIRMATSTVLVLIFGALGPADGQAQSAPSNYLRFELGKDNYNVGGQVFLYDYQPTPISASVTGCNLNGNECRQCPSGAARLPGTGMGYVGNGRASWRITAVDNCPQYQGVSGAFSYCVAETYIYDVVFTDVVSGGAGTIQVSLNLDTVNLTSGTQTPELIVKIGGSTVYRGEPGTGTLTTSFKTVSLNQFVPVSFQLRSSVGTVAPTHSEVFREASVSFASGLQSSSPGVLGTAQPVPVFNVPEGITVNSAQGDIVNNAWNAPVATESISWGRLKALHE